MLDLDLLEPPRPGFVDHSIIVETLKWSHVLKNILTDTDEQGAWLARSQTSSLYFEYFKKYLQIISF